MPAKSYSTRFLIWSLAAGALQRYTVPAGSRAVLREMDLIIFTSAGGNVILNIAGVTTFLKAFPASGAYQVYVWQGSMVVMGGEQVFVQADASVQMGGYLGGYLFAT